MSYSLIVVYKKTSRGKKYYLEVFNNVFVDDILNNNMKKPLIPYKYELIEVGVGEKFIEKYKKKYNPSFVEKVGN